jgi:murein DD-endopeptidase MepM/ murein hydrolase activator NlpD
MRSPFLRLCVALGILASAGPTAGAAARYSGYVAPVQVDGMVFPVARSAWYSVINFTDDWHDPRMRFENGHWELVGVHEGNDIFAEPGTPIVASLGGRVENLGWTFYSGWRVGVRGDDGRYWFYAHMSRFAPGLSIGDRVEAGSLLGEVGNTGYGAVPGHDGEFTYHLHIGIQEADGTWANPYPLMRRLYRAAVQP